MSLQSDSFYSLVTSEGYADPDQTVGELVGKYTHSYVTIEELPWTGDELLSGDISYEHEVFVLNSNYFEKAMEIAKKYSQYICEQESSLGIGIYYIIFYQHDERHDYYDDGDYSSWPIIERIHVFRAVFNAEDAPEDCEWNMNYGEVISVDEI